jgi:precorrin-2 dehydrogenase/sirohydrochlorin ferrochelatase
MMRYYPLFLDLTARRVVVVGGGPVAERKIRQLLACRARVLAISPTLTPRLRAWVRAGRVRWQPRRYRRGDLGQAWFVVAASNEPEANGRVAHDAERRGILVNVVDDPARSSAIAPAWFRRGALIVAFSTGGASPALARQLRLRLSRGIGKEYSAYVAFLARLRRQVHRQVKDAVTRQRLMRRLVRANLLSLIKEGDRRTLKRRLTRLTKALVKF